MEMPDMRHRTVAWVGLALACFCGALFAAEGKRRVVFCTASEYVAYPQIGVEEFGLAADRFCLSPDEGHGRANVEGFRAALAGTRVLVFGPPQDGAHPNLELIFADAENVKAVKEFLKSGGTLVIDQTRTDLSAGFTKFLADMAVAVPKSGGLPPLEKKQQYTAVAAKEGKDARHPLATAPNAFGARELGPRVNAAFASWGPKQCAPIRSFQKPAFGVLVAQEGVNGAGRVVFNTTGMFNSTRNDGAQLCENLYSLAFGAEVRRVAPPRTRYVVKTGWRTWVKDPYAGFPLDRDAPDKFPLDRIKVSAAVNERQSFAVLITNAAAGPVADLAFSCGELKSGADALTPVVLRELVFDRSDGANPDPLPETKGIAVAPGETRILWLTFDTMSAKPGEYQGELSLTPAGGAARKLPVAVRVLPITLPVENPLRFTTWELFFSWRDKLVEGRENWKYFHQDMIDHGVNVFHASFGNPPRIVDAAGKPVFAPDAFNAMKERLYTTDNRSMYLIYGNIEEPFRVQDKKGVELKFPSPEHARAYKAYVGEISKFFKGLGMTNDQFAFYPYDEIAPASVPNALLTYAAIREADPKANIFVTLGGNSLNGFFEAKTGRPVKDLAPYVTIWVPGIAFYPYFANPNSDTARRTAKVIEFCKGTGNQVWSYNVTTRSSYELAPYQRYRLKPWGALALGLGGYGFYGANHWKEGDTYTAFYPGPRPVPGIRWEAVREGLNDVKYLIVLKEEIARAKKAGRPAAAAEELLSRALAEVNAKSLDASLAPAYREKIAAMILELRK
jgi:hypothetical protein